MSLVLTIFVVVVLFFNCGTDLKINVLGDVGFELVMLKPNVTGTDSDECQLPFDTIFSSFSCSC